MTGEEDACRGWSLFGFWLCFLIAQNAENLEETASLESAKFRLATRDLDVFVLRFSVLERNVNIWNWQLFRANVGALPQMKKEAAPYGLRQPPRISPPHGIAKNVAG